MRKPITQVAISAILCCVAITATPAPVVSNRPASNVEVGYLPKEGGPPSSNPPALAWLDEKGATSWTIQISRDPQFSEIVVEKTDWPWLLYTHNAPLPEGDYFWRYRFSQKSGKQSGWSKTREFRISRELVKFPRPSADQLRRLIPTEHPRMFTRPEKLPELQSYGETSSPEMLEFLSSADKYLDYKLMAEPKPWTGGKWNVDEWREYLKQASATTARMDSLAFAWLLTGEEKYGKRAKQHLMNFVRWDPLGPSSMKVNDEVGMPVLHSVSRAYDWLYPLLSSEDRALILESMRARGEETYHHMRRKPYEQFAHNSHFGRMWHFLGEAGLAFYGEIPEAEKWLNYATTTFYGWYPYWGNPDGGWAEGMWYWASYNTRVTWWLDLMRETLGIDGAKKPFYAHVGDFPLYVCPPGNPVGGFGDFSERPAPMSTVGKAMAAFALYRDNSAWQWYAEQVGVTSSGSGPFGIIRSRLEKPEAHPPTELPLLKMFPRIGYALFHSDMIHADRNVHVAMRCSPYGNVSHSHNDQNAIVMSAYGEPLLVNTGRRDFYGSKFCKQYYWHTLSHNGLLIGGEGQSRGIETTATYVAHGETDDVAWVVGDATNAYGEKAQLYRRWMIFLPETGAVMVDEIETTAPDITLLFHGRAPFTTSDAEKRFNLVKGEVQLQGTILLPGMNGRFTGFSQTDQYPLPMASGIKPLFDEWHLKADVAIEEQVADRACVVTVLEVARGAESQQLAGSWTAEENGDRLVVRRTGDGLADIVLTLDTRTLNVVRE